jgi:hypothetical protein
MGQKRVRSGSDSLGTLNLLKNFQIDLMVAELRVASLQPAPDDSHHEGTRIQHCL